jgi:hypothetical protein
MRYMLEVPASAPDQDAEVAREIFSCFMWRFGPIELAFSKVVFLLSFFLFIAGLHAL